MRAFLENEYDDKKKIEDIVGESNWQWMVRGSKGKRTNRLLLDKQVGPRTKQHNNQFGAANQTARRRKQ